MDGSIGCSSLTLEREERLKTKKIIGFEVLTAVSTKIAVFWFVTPCSLVDVYQRFRDRPDDGGSKDL
jgi:hypothetical protein